MPRSLSHVLLLATEAKSSYSSSSNYSKTFNINEVYNNKKIKKKFCDWKNYKLRMSKYVIFYEQL